MLPSRKFLHYPAVSFSGKVKHNPEVNNSCLGKLVHFTGGEIPAVGPIESSVVEVTESQLDLRCGKEELLIQTIDIGDKCGSFLQDI